MKILPSIFSTLGALTCLGLSIWIFFTGRENQALQGQLALQQQELYNYEQVVQGHQQELQRQQQIIERGATIAQQYGKPILSQVGIRSVKNNNSNLRDLLMRHKLDKDFIPSKESLQKAEAASGQAGALPDKPANSNPLP